MNICYISDVDISRLNGPGINEREFVRSLQMESEPGGDEVFFIIRKYSKQLDIRLKNAEYYETRYVKRSSFLGLRLVSTTWHLAKLVLRRLKRTNIDLFVLRLNHSSVLIPLLLSLLGQKYVIKTLGDIYSFQKDGNNCKDRLYFAILRKVLWKAMKDAAFIDVCTPQFYENYRNKYRLHNIKVIENSVNIERFYPMNKELCKKKCDLGKFDRIIGYCGGFPSRRGAGEIVQLSRSLILKYPHCGILVIGQDRGLDKLRREAKELGTYDHIVFKGLVNYEEMPFYINCLDVGIALDTDEKINSVGNSSQKIRQYLACGVPIICPEKTNTKIIDGGFALAVSKKDLDQLYDAICFWLDMGRVDLEDLRKRAYQFAKNNFSTKLAYKVRYKYWKTLAMKNKNMSVSDSCISKADLSRDGPKKMRHGNIY